MTNYPLLDTQKTFKLANVEKNEILTIKPLKYEKFKFQKRFNWSTIRYDLTRTVTPTKLILFQSTYLYKVRRIAIRVDL